MLLCWPLKAWKHLQISQFHIQICENQVRIFSSVPVGAAHWHTYLLIGANKEVCITEKAVLFDRPLKSLQKATAAQKDWGGPVQ